MERKERHKRNWPQIIEKWKSSGKSVKEFCSDEGLHKSDFYRMRKKLSMPERKFIKLTDNSQPNNGSTIIVETPEKYRLELPDNVSPHRLKTVLEVLRGAACS